MNIIHTPVMENWHLHNGAIYAGSTKLAAAALALDPSTGKPAILVVIIRSDDQFFYLGLDEPHMVEIIFQLVAAHTGEHYRIDTSRMMVTDFAHIWVDTETLWYYFMDETSSANGPFRTQHTANERLHQYCMHSLQDGTNEYEVTYDSVADFDPEMSNFKRAKAYGRHYDGGKEYFNKMYPGNKIMSIDLLEPKQ